MKVNDYLIEMFKIKGKEYLVDSVIIGLHLTMVICKNKKGEIKAGLASTMPKWSPQGRCPAITNPGTFAGSTADTLINMLNSSLPQEASIAIATINSISQFQDENNYTTLKAQKLIEKVSNKKILAVIGHFPFLSQLEEKVKKLLIFELEPIEGELPSQSIPEFLPQADIVAITGTTFINNTIDEILFYSKNAQLKIVMGPSTPLVSKLFNFGIDILAGTIIENLKFAKKFLLEGASTAQLKGKKSVCLLNKSNKLINKVIND